ncbi:MAG: acyl-CoA dehydratase activase [Candidatus Bathyarchaeota archaeon]|nr:acyl-CoA dehydratase activase [Candidatus Bathyarchaeota archaeon]MDH5788558.1 acyl-CoA dehydratase activase [Candidatus Bathyarchaeota archaeon]
MSERSSEFWRWREYRHTQPNMDWNQAKIVTAGIDIGSVGSKAAIILDGQLYAYSVMRTGGVSEETAFKVMNWALEGTGLKTENLHQVVGTGYGRVNIPFANKTITEIACHARGAHYIYGPSVRTVLDIGGQDCKAIRCDNKGKVMSFLMNDKCAAGTGRGLEVFSDLIRIPIEEVGKVSLNVTEEPPPVSNTCVIFAKAESVALLRQGWPKEKVAAAYHLAMVDRIIDLLTKVGIEKDFVITGGVAKNIGIATRLETNLGIKPLEPELDPILAGAIGAALFANALYEKQLGLR